MTEVGACVGTAVLEHPAGEAQFIIGQGPRGDWVIVGVMTPNGSALTGAVRRAMMTQPGGE
ncbi:MAG: hypothetical protein WBX15_12235 [Thermoanaerobaculia bacterium]